MEDRYTNQWFVPSNSNPNKKYKVSLKKDGNFECSCPGWIYRHKECTHIAQIKLAGPSQYESPLFKYLNPKKPPVYTLAVVPTPIVKGERLLVPLIQFGDTWMEATICYVMVESGYSWGKVKEIRHIPNEWTLAKVKNYIDDKGKKVYPKGA